jgi:hypothetical protein
MIGATSVTFNGTAAVFTVVRPSEISRRPYQRARPLAVEVITPSGTLSSKVLFRVLP